MSGMSWESPKVEFVFLLLQLLLKAALYIYIYQNRLGERGREGRKGGRDEFGSWRTIS